jgi:hypothetical protein
VDATPTAIARHQAHPSAARSPCTGVGSPSRDPIGGYERERQLLVMLGVYLLTVGLFNHAQASSGVQVQGHPGEQLPWGNCEVTFAHSSKRLELPSVVALPCPAWSAHQRTAPDEHPV